MIQSLPLLFIRHSPTPHGFFPITVDISFSFDDHRDRRLVDDEHPGSD